MNKATRALFTASLFFLSALVAGILWFSFGDCTELPGRLYHSTSRVIERGIVSTGDTPKLFTIESSSLAHALEYEKRLNKPQGLRYDSSGYLR